VRSEIGARFGQQILLDRAAVFQPLPGAGFIVNGAAPAKDSALVTASAELRLADGVALLGKFDGEFAARSATGSLRW
jgi:uncharacterized protein with beta-barrel porin domain